MLLCGKGVACKENPPVDRKSSLMKPVFVSVVSIPSMSLFSVVFVPVTPLSVSTLLLIFVIAAVPVMVFVVCVASVAPVISGRCSAAVPAPVRGVAPQAPSCGGGSISRLHSAPLQAGGAQRVQEEALVGAPQGTLQPSCGAHGLCSHTRPVRLPEELLYRALFQVVIFCHRVAIDYAP